ncbi:MAG: hypothetical protein E7053_04400 [Lentisphaerae bacterium]|nr:hypothetical protein [Lentisphaerota bacterium]
MNIDHLTTIPEMPAGLTMLRRIGNGGAGNIFMVQDITGKFLALKAINPRWHQKELDAITDLRNLPAHPAVTQIYQTGKLSDGNFFYTMELADNAGNIQHYIPDTLAYRIVNGKLSAADALSTIRVVTAGVAHLHNHQLFHGDIKPENIIFINGQAKISDFGTLSESGNAGTAGFIPDDPVNGIDRDCYALAKTLYCAYSGCDAADFPSPPEKFNADEFRIIRQLYIKGCAGQVKKRFSSISDWQNALDQTISRLARPHKTGKLRTKFALFTGGILLSAGTVFTLLTAGNKTEIRQQAAAGPAVTFTFPASVETHSPDGSETATDAAVTGHNFSSPMDATGNNTPDTQDTGEPAGQDTPQPTPPENYAEYGYDVAILRLSSFFDGGFISFPGFREMFEVVYREMPDRLDADYCRELLQYYTDLDRFLQLRGELSAPGISLDKLHRRFTESNYQALFNSLQERNGTLQSTETGNEQIRLIRQLYHTINQQNHRPDGSREE